MGAGPECPAAADQVLTALARAAMTVSLEAAGQAGGLSLAQLQALTLLTAGPLTVTRLAGAVVTPADSASAVERPAGRRRVRRP